VLKLYRALIADDYEAQVEAYRIWVSERVARVDRHPEHLGPLHLRPAAR